MTTLRLTAWQDDETGSGYVQITDAPVVATIDLGLVIVDLDEHGRTVGIEFFGHLTWDVDTRDGRERWSGAT